MNHRDTAPCGYSMHNICSLAVHFVKCCCVNVLLGECGAFNNYLFQCGDQALWLLSQFCFVIPQF